jgi:hypothetical protein
VICVVHAEHTHSLFSPTVDTNFLISLVNQRWSNGGNMRALLTAPTSQPVVSSLLADEVAREPAVTVFNRRVAKSYVVTAFAKCVTTPV